MSTQVVGALIGGSRYKPDMEASAVLSILFRHELFHGINPAKISPSRDTPSRGAAMAPPKMVYQLKITLFDTQPKIWRRILIPTSVTFWELHSAIQDVFHWNHSHLHHFWYDDKIFKKSIWFGIPTDEDDMYNVEIYPSWKHKISKYLNLEEPNLKYVYDLGDNWIHLIELENILPAEKARKYPVCIEGKRNAPPDDCGGVHGYDSMLEVLADPTDEEYEATKEWIDSIIGGTFDPAYFDPAEVKFMNPKQRYRESFE